MTPESVVALIAGVIYASGNKSVLDAIVVAEETQGVLSHSEVVVLIAGVIYASRNRNKNVLDAIAVAEEIAQGVLSRSERARAEPVRLYKNG